MKDFMYLIRTSQYEIYTDKYDVGKYYLTVRMPKDCWQVFEIAKSSDAIAYRRNGYMWIQFKTYAVHCVSKLYNKKFAIVKLFPKNKDLYSL